MVLTGAVPEDPGMVPESGLEPATPGGGECPPMPDGLRIVVPGRPVLKTPIRFAHDSVTRTPEVFSAGAQEKNSQHGKPRSGGEQVAVFIAARRRSICPLRIWRPHPYGGKSSQQRMWAERDGK